MTVIDMIFYWAYRKTHDIPHQDEMLELIYEYPLPFEYIDKKPNRALDVARKYAMGSSIEETSKDFEITRERARQIVWKVWRKYKNPKSNEANEYV